MLLRVHSSFGEESANYFALFVALVSRDYCVAFPHYATGLSAACECGIC